MRTTSLNEIQSLEILISGVDNCFAPTSSSKQYSSLQSSDSATRISSSIHFAPWRLKRASMRSSAGSYEKWRKTVWRARKVSVDLGRRGEGGGEVGLEASEKDRKVLSGALVDRGAKGSSVIERTAGRGVSWPVGAG